MMKFTAIISLLVFILPALLLTACSSSDEGTVTFDGENCTYEGPTLLKAGTFTLNINNNSEERAGVDLVRLTRDKTIQDMIDFIGEYPTADRPHWASGLGTYHFMRADESIRWEGALEPGFHTIACVRITDHLVWFGTGLTVEN